MVRERRPLFDRSQIPFEDEVRRPSLPSSACCRSRPTVRRRAVAAGARAGGEGEGETAEPMMRAGAARRRRLASWPMVTASSALRVAAKTSKFAVPSI